MGLMRSDWPEEYETPHYRSVPSISLAPLLLMVVVCGVVAAVVGAVVIGGMYGFFLLWVR
jgi:hypothetical protein